MLHDFTSPSTPQLVQSTCQADWLQPRRRAHSKTAARSLGNWPAQGGAAVQSTPPAERPAPLPGKFALASCTPPARGQHLACREACPAGRQLRPGIMHPACEGACPAAWRGARARGSPQGRRRRRRTRSRPPRASAAARAAPASRVRELGCAWSCSRPRPRASGTPPRGREIPAASSASRGRRAGSAASPWWDRGGCPAPPPRGRCRRGAACPEEGPSGPRRSRRGSGTPAAGGSDWPGPPQPGPPQPGPPHRGPWAPWAPQGPCCRGSAAAPALARPPGGRGCRRRTWRRPGPLTARSRWSPAAPR